MTEERKKALHNIKTAKGQIEGIIEMLEEERYCVDISTQLLATIAILKKANLNILEGHLEHCVSQSLISNDPAIKKEKIDEIVNVIKRMS